MGSYYHFFFGHYFFYSADYNNQQSIKDFPYITEN